MSTEIPETDDSDIEIDCPRAKSDMTPCVARDGDTACTNSGFCVGCGEHSAELLRDLVIKYIKLKRAAQQHMQATDAPQGADDNKEYSGVSA